MVEEGIVSDPNLILKTKEKFSKNLSVDYELMGERDYYFLSKHYPDLFNKLVAKCLVSKNRMFAKKIIYVASKFSGISNKIARYIRSETSEKRACNIFSSIYLKMYEQDNLKELFVQFADAKHDLLLSKIIKTCPKEYLYLFISNKVIRDSHSNASYYFRKRNM